MRSIGIFARLGGVALAALCLAALPAALCAQEATPVQTSSTQPLALTLKRAVELAVQNSKDIQLAKIQVQVADNSARLTKSDFLPNLYAGSGAGYTYGIPETPGGRAPSIFSVTYSEKVFDGPLSGLVKEQQEQARSQRILLEETRTLIMARVASAYLELVKVHHSLQLLRKEKDSAEKIVGITEERQGEGYELPMEVTRSQLTRAQVVQRILQLEGRQDELEVYLRNQLGFAAEQPVDVAAEDLPRAAEQEGANLIASAMENNSSLLAAQSDVKAKEYRLQGERRGYLPTLELVSVYSVLAKFNNYTNYFKDFQYNNFNAGVNIQVPIFAAKTRASIALAQSNLDLAKVNLAGKRIQVSAEIRQKSRRVQEMGAAREVSRLELQLAQQNVGVLQSQFNEGKMNLRDVEKARLEESEKWMSYLDANFLRQQAQLELLRAAGQMDKVLE